MDSSTIIATDRLSLWYGETRALEDVSVEVPDRKVTALIGPSGCGKSTLLRCFNRMNDLLPGCRIGGRVVFHGRNIYENVAYGPRVHGIRDRRELDRIVEWSLRRAALWDEVRDRLSRPAVSLSGGQQQRLCIARTLAVEPEVILMDEPCSALDPIATAKVVGLIDELKKQYCVIIVTHNMQQAARVSDCTGFMYLGRLVEFGETAQVFESPRNELTENYITGRFG